MNCKIKYRHLALFAFLLIASVPDWCSGQLIRPASRQPATPPNRPAPKKVGTKMTGFGVPFAISDPENKFIEVQLYMSKNRGVTWQFYGRQNLDGKEFAFQSNGDGEYWFALKTLDRNRKLQPPGDTHAELIVVVDTLMPELDFRVQPDAAGRVVCRWQAKDQNIDPNTVRLSYRPLLSTNDQENNWIDVPYKAVEIAQNGLFADQYAFWVDNSAVEMLVRMQISDIGSNAAIEERQITSPRMSGNPNQSGSRLAANQPPVRQVSSPPKNQQRPAAPNQNPDGSGSTAPSANSNQALANNRQPPQQIGPGPSSSQTGWNIRKAPSGSNQPPTSLPTTDANKNETKKVATPQFNSNSGTSLYGRDAQSPVGPQNNNLAIQQSSSTVTWHSQPSATDGREKSLSNAWPTQESDSAVMTLGEGTTKPTSDSVVQSGQKPVATPPMSQTEVFPAASNPAMRPKPLLPDSNSAKANNLLTPPAAKEDASLTPVPKNDVQTAPTFPKGHGTPTENPTAEDFTLENSNLPAPNPTNSVLEKLSGSSIPIAFAPKADGSLNIEPVNTKRFRLNYQNDFLSPAMVAKVTLWMTTDGGQTWSAYGEDADFTSPFAVQVEHEGTYGFRVVFQSTEGAQGRTPARGDEPDMWIRVDVTAPTAVLLSAPYGRGEQAGSLVINWQATDDELGDRPIQISYSRQSDGPWTTIINGQSNTESYAWKTGADVSEKVYLKLTVTDAAGNITETATTRPIDLAGLIPRGRILSVDPVK